MKKELNMMTKKVLLLALNMVCLTALGQDSSGQTTARLTKKKNKETSDSLQRRVNIREGALTFAELLVDKSGLQVTQSGTTGLASQLMIRGLGSINLNNSPYVYVDGIPVRYSRALPSLLSIYQPSRFSFVNTNDIKTIKVAKEGMELSTHGGRGTNGAIYIETDRGELGGTKIDFSAKFGLLKANYDVKRMGADEFKDYLRNYFLENGSSEVEASQHPIFDTSKPTYNNNTDWMRLIAKNGLLSWLCRPERNY
jgi:hypothetical protein